MTESRFPFPISGGRSSPLGKRKNPVEQSGSGARWRKRDGAIDSRPDRRRIVPSPRLVAASLPWNSAGDAGIHFSVSLGGGARANRDRRSDPSGGCRGGGHSDAPPLAQCATAGHLWNFRVGEEPALHRQLSDLAGIRDHFRRALVPADRGAPVRGRVRAARLVLGKESGSIGRGLDWGVRQEVLNGTTGTT